jgi:hypothetical protein
VLYQVQDLRCEKCKHIKADNMSEVCTNCSGKFVCLRSAEDFRSGYVHRPASCPDNMQALTSQA